MDDATHVRGVRKFTIDAATDWMEWNGVGLADVASEDDEPDMKLGAIGFTWAPAGSTSTFDFAYDEALVVTRGTCTIQSNDRSVTAGPGQVIYLPANVPGSFRADEDLELVYVASSPYGEVNREAKAALLAGERGRVPRARVMSPAVVISVIAILIVAAIALNVSRNARR